LLARDSRNRRGKYYSVSSLRNLHSENFVVDPEDQQSHHPAVLAPAVTSEPEIMIRLIELLPDIIHGHSPSNGTRNNRIHDASHERVD
jgi:hypothetical protein